MKLYQITVLLICLTNLPTTSATSQRYKDTTNLINVWLDAQKDYANIPAIFGLVVKDQETLWMGAFGESNLADNQKANSDTLTSICSISKVITATTIMKLVDEGRLSLDDKVSDILPDLKLKQAFPENEAITVSSLLSHTSGVPRDTHHAYWSAPEHHFPSVAELYETLATEQTTHQVGERVAYSNVGYALLGQIIAKTVDMSYKNYVEQNLFKPLNMNRSVVELPSRLVGKEHAVGYTALNRNGKRTAAHQYQTRAMQSAAGISTTISDMAEFMKWQFRLADTGGKELMSFESLKTMYQVHAVNQQGAKRGYGYEVYDDATGNRWVQHGGMCPGYNSFIKIDTTNRMGYAFFVNANKIRAAAYINGLIEIFKRAEFITDEKSIINLSQYTGFYDVNPWNSEYYIGQWGAGLMLMYFPAESLNYSLYQYSYVEEDTFELIQDGQATGEMIEFLRDASGKVVKVKNDGGYHPRK